MLHQAQKFRLIFRSKREQLIEELDRRRRSNEAVQVDVDKRGHDHLTVEAVHEPAVTRYGIAEVFYFESSLKSAGKEATERPDGGGEDGQRERMLLNGLNVELQRGQQVGERTRQIVRMHLEHAQRFAVGVEELRRLVVLERTHELAVVAEYGGQHEAEYDGGEGAADEALPGLLGRQLDQPGASKKKAEHVGHDVIADDERDGQQEPDEALEHVLDHEIRLGHDEQKGQVRVAEQRELLEIVGLLQREHEGDEAGRVERERDEAVVGDEGRQKVAASQQQRKLFDQTLAVQVVVGSDQKVPADGAKPGQMMRFVDKVADGDYFVKAFDLNGQNEYGDGQRAQVDHEREGEYHDPGEDAAHDPVAPAGRQVLQGRVEHFHVARVLADAFAARHARQRFHLLFGGGGRLLCPILFLVSLLLLLLLLILL